MAKALLIDYRYCDGCHTCEVACQSEHDYPADSLGIVINQIGPFALDESEKHWQYDFVPIPTDFCDGCAKRVSRGKLPSCVQHCQLGCMSYGRIDELAKQANHYKCALYTIEAQ